MIWGGAAIRIIDIKCTIHAIGLNYPETTPAPWYIEKLSSPKPVPCAKKVGDCWFRAFQWSASLCFWLILRNVWVTLYVSALFVVMTVPHLNLLTPWWIMNFPRAWITLLRFTPRVTSLSIGPAQRLLGKRSSTIRDVAVSDLENPLGSQRIRGFSQEWD